MHTHLHTLHRHARMHTCAPRLLCIHTCTQTSMHTHTCAHNNTHLCTHSHVRTLMHAHTHSVQRLQRLEQLGALWGWDIVGLGPPKPGGCWTPAEWTAHSLGSQQWHPFLSSSFWQREWCLQTQPVEGFQAHWKRKLGYPMEGSPGADVQPDLAGALRGPSEWGPSAWDISSGLGPGACPPAPALGGCLEGWEHV